MDILVIRSRIRRDRGFTLLEVLIAFAIISVSASIMLQQLHSIMKYADRAIAKQVAINQGLNQASLFSTIDWKNANSRVSEKQMVVEYSDFVGFQKSMVVENFSIDDVSVPMTIAFSPFQIFDFGGNGDFKIRMLQPGLLPVVGNPTAVLARRS